MPSLRSLLVTFAVIAVFGLAALEVSAQDESPAAHAPPPTPVGVATVRMESLAPRKKVFGDLRPARISTVAAEEAGIVTTVTVREGEVVERGEVIARLDGSRLAVEVEICARTLLSALAAITERTASGVLAERHLALLRAAEAKGGTNPRELLDAQGAVDVAHAQMKQAAALLSIAQSNEDLLEIRQSDLEIRAPFRGVVTRKHTDLGAWLGAGDPVVDLAETERLEAMLEVPQELFDAARTEAGRLQSDAQAASTIEVRDALDRVVRTSALRLIPAIDPRSRTFRAIFDVANNEGVYAAGLALTAFVPAGVASAHPVIPKDALLRGDAGAYVYAVRNGISVPVSVRVAFPFGDFVALEHGSLKADEVVVTEGNERLMPMSPVAPVSAPVSAPVPAPVSAPVSAPVPAPVSAPVSAPAAAAPTAATSARGAAQ